MTEDEYLSERCRIMLQDFLKEVIEHDISGESSLREANDFIDDFMRRHNLE